MPSGRDRLAGEQVLGGGIGAILGDADRHALPARAFGIGGEDGSDDLEIVVETGRGAMHRPDEGGGAAADDAKAQPTSELRDRAVHGSVLPERMRIAKVTRATGA